MVQSYPPVNDAKITVEKPVREKPKLSELTKIEKPGRPVSASEHEELPKKRTRKKKKDSEVEVRITKTKKDAVLIITEKPQAALKIASALADKAPRKYSENHVSFYELEKDGKKIIVASAVGHIFNLTYVKGQTGWPIFEIEWVPSYRQKHSAYTKNYYTLLKNFQQGQKKS